MIPMFNEYNEVGEIKKAELIIRGDILATVYDFTFSLSILAENSLSAIIVTELTSYCSLKPQIF